jgi:hypothetical protein
MSTTPSTTPTAPLVCRDRQIALRNRAKAKAKATREKFHQRADGWTDPKERVKVAERLIKSVIRRVEFPKYGDPFPLSPTDKMDAEAAGFAACVESGFFEHGFATPAIFKAIRNAINSRACLRLRCTWEYGTDDAAGVAAKVGFCTEFEEFEKRLSASQRDMAKEIMRTLRAAFSCDESRKAVSAFRSQRDFFLIVLGHLTERTGRAMTSGTFDTRKSRFMDYLAKGAQALRANRQAPPSLAAEIMQALSDRALA